MKLKGVLAYHTFGGAKTQGKEDHGGAVAFVDQLAVDEQWRNRGCALHMLRSLPGEATELIVDRGNTAAVHFYTQAGFRRAPGARYRPRSHELALCMHAGREHSGRGRPPLAPLSPGLEVAHKTWGGMTDEEREDAIVLVAEGMRTTMACAAEELLRVRDVDMRYVCLLLRG